MPTSLARERSRFLPPAQRRSRTRILVLAVLALFPLRALAVDDFDRWYVVLMDGQRCGWNHEKQATEGDVVTTTRTMTLKIRRGTAELGLTMESEFVETADGDPISSRSERDDGSTPIGRTVTWTPSGVRIVTTQGARRTEQTVAKPGDEWLTPAEAAEFVRSHLADGAETIEYKSIDPMEGLSLLETTITELRPRTIEVGGRRVRATECRMRMSSPPNMSVRMWLDESGTPVRSEIPLGALSLTLELSDKATALRRGEAPEVIVNTLIHPSRAIDEPRRTRTGSYVLTVTGEATLPELPQTSTQSVEPLSGGRVRVSVEVDPTRSFEVSDTREYLASNQSMDLDDAELRSLATTSLERSGTDPSRRAEALRRAVYRYIRDKSLGITFASASETCRSRAGDCTEHAVLLAALLRIDGIPSRVVSGLVYADEYLGESGVFAFHMWTQALLEVDGKQRWVDLDAALSATTPFDATHIALATTALEDGSQDDMSIVVPLMGALKVDVRRTGR